MFLILIVLNLYKINAKIDKTKKKKALTLLSGGREDAYYNFREKRER